MPRNRATFCINAVNAWQRKELAFRLVVVLLFSQGGRPAMECELWPRLYEVVVKVGKRVRPQRVRYSDVVIALVFLWGCLHDRPQSWACEARNWKSTRLRPAAIPSDSTPSRRLRSPSVLQLMQAVGDHVRSLGDPGLLKFIDGKPLLVGVCSKDPDARTGHTAGGMARGYKLHVIEDSAPFPEAWT